MKRSRSTTAGQANEIKSRIRDFHVWYFSARPSYLQSPFMEHSTAATSSLLKTATLVMVSLLMLFISQKSSLDMCSQRPEGLGGRRLSRASKIAVREAHLVKPKITRLLVRLATGSRQEQRQSKPGFLAQAIDCVQGPRTAAFHTNTAFCRHHDVHS